MKFALFNSATLATALMLPHRSFAATSRLRGDADGLVRNQRVLEKEMVGTFLIADIDYDDSTSGSKKARPSHTFNVEMPDGSIYELGGVSALSSKDRVSGRDIIKIPSGAVVSGMTIDLGGADIEVVDPKHLDRDLKGEKARRTPAQERNLAALRRRQLQSGNKKLLAVRVVAADASYTMSEAQLSDDVLGTGGDPVNLASQYAACSYGALTFEGAGDRTRTGSASVGSTDIANGVVTVKISQSVTGVENAVIRDAVTAQLGQNFGTSAGDLADHVMLCLPPGTSGEWIAYAFINSWLSVYNNDWCNYLSGQVHEMGHNLGFGHSGDGTSTYGDYSGMMGISYKSDDGPKMCFNAAKSWQTGWYTTKSAVVEPADIFARCFEGDLHGVADFGNNDAERVLVKINDNGPIDHYVTFNSQKGINSGTQEAGDQVTVTTQGNEGSGYSASSLVAKLSAGGTYSQTIGGKNMVVTVLSVDAGAGKAAVRISENGAPCGPAPPSPPPTSGPTATPCPEAEFTVDILADGYPAEVSWNLVNICGNEAIQEAVAAGTRYDAPGTQYSDTYCVPRQQYRFEIRDTMNDGICCSFGQGSYSITYDGTVRASGGEYQSLETSTFGSCSLVVTPGPTKDPTLLPTPPPTDVPTYQPTAIPTTGVAPEPTRLPTKEPTFQPTSAPIRLPLLTKEPTSPPTDVPTYRPTTKPTRLPTKKPTPPPTSSPTEVPTHQPTTKPTDAPTPVPTGPPSSNPTKELTLLPTNEGDGTGVIMDSASPTIMVAPTKSPATGNGSKASKRAKASKGAKRAKANTRNGGNPFE